MVEILLIIPYEKVKNHISTISKSLSTDDIIFKTTHIYGTGSNLNDFPNADIVVSRGITFGDLKTNYPDKYILEFPINSFDIFAAISKCISKYSPKKIMICCRTTSFLELDSLSKLLNIDIVAHEITTEEDLNSALEIGESTEVDAYIGGLTLLWKCKKQNIPCVHIQTSDYTLEQTIGESVNIAEKIISEREKSATVQSILNNVPDSIISLDHNGCIIAINNQARLTCMIDKEINVIGLPIEKFNKSFNYKESLRNFKEIESLEKIGPNLHFVRISPIKTEDNLHIVIITIQATKKIQTTETKIRHALGAKGLVAKYNFENIISKSTSMATCLKQAHKYSGNSSNVFLVGETGTGKELFAQSIHNNSPRRNNPFVPINCAALSENLLESELFGYVEGAFSGAVKGGKVGLFELAHKGTIFLDEIGEISASMQVKLLRVLQEREVRRVGDTKVIPIDVRVISATNVNIFHRINCKEFRQDLYYRLNLMSITIPPLRERKEDIMPLIDWYCTKFSAKYEAITPSFTRHATDYLKEYSWPGNVRELRNFCERLIVLNENILVDNADLEELGLRSTLPSFPKEINPNKKVDQELLNIISKTKITKEELAKALGVSRTTLWRWSKEQN